MDAWGKPVGEAIGQRKTASEQSFRLCTRTRCLHLDVQGMRGAGASSGVPHHVDLMDFVHQWDQGSQNGGRVLARLAHVLDEMGEARRGHQLGTQSSRHKLVMVSCTVRSQHSASVERQACSCSAPQGKPPDN